MPNTTVPAAGEAMPIEQIVDGYRDLEDSLARANCMAIALDDLLDLKCGKGQRTEARGYIIRISQEEYQSLAFVWKELRSITGQALAQFYSVEHEENANA